MTAMGEGAPVAYSKEAAAKAIGVSLSHLNELLDEGQIRPSYSKSKPLIARAELERYVASRPSERPAVSR